MDARLFCRMCYKHYAHLKRSYGLRFIESGRLLCTSTTTSKGHKLADQNQDKDPLPYFLDPWIHKLLKRMTSFSADRSSESHVIEKTEQVKYSFVTDEGLQKLEEGFAKKARYKLQMPPVMKPWQPLNKVISTDSKLEGYTADKVVFTDISAGLPNRKRTIVVRETDGTLRHAEPDERDRMLQVYYPRNGKSMFPPGMFEDEYMKILMDENKYIYLLDKACIQFEPNDPLYIKITHTIYEDVTRKGCYDLLRYTRHFGPMAFHFAWNLKIDGLLRDMLEGSLISDAIDLIDLTSRIHPHMKMHVDKKRNLDLQKEINIIQKYIDKYAGTTHKGPMELALQEYQISAQQKKEAAS